MSAGSLQGLSSPKNDAIRQRVLSKIASGLHVALLGQRPKQQHEPEDEAPEASMENVLRVFRHFRRLKRIEREQAAETKLMYEVKRVQEAWCEPNMKSAIREVEEYEAGANPISRLHWATFQAWVEQEATCGVHPQYRRTLAAVLRGLQLWKQLCASPAQSSEGHGTEAEAI